MGLVLGSVLTAPAIAQGEGEVDFDALWASGEPLAGAEIAVYQNERVAGPKVFADAGGNATTRLPAGDYTAWLRTPDGQWSSQEFSVRAGETTPVRLTANRLPPFFPTGLQWGLGFATTAADDLVGTSFTDFRTDTANGVSGPRQNRSPDAGAQNGLFDYEVDSDAFYTDFILPLWRGQRPPHAASGPRHAYPYARAIFGRMELDFTQQPTGGQGSRVAFASDPGWLYGGAVGMVWDCKATSPWFGAGEIGWMGSEELDADRSPGASSSTGTVTSERYTLQTERLTIQAAAGYELTPRFSVSVGARYVEQRLEYDGRVEVDFSAAAGFPASSRFEVSSEHEDDWIEALAGVDVRVSTRLFGRVQASSDGDNSSLAFGLTYKF